MAGFRPISTTLPGRAPSFTAAPSRNDFLTALLQKKSLETGDVRHPLQVAGKLAQAAAAAFRENKATKKVDARQQALADTLRGAVNAKGVKAFNNPGPEDVNGISAGGELVPALSQRQAVVDALMGNVDTVEAGFNLATQPPEPPSFLPTREVKRDGNIITEEATADGVRQIGTSPRFQPRAPFAPTPVQQANNIEIGTARDQLQRRVGEVPPGLTPREVIQGMFAAAARHGTAPPPFLQQAMKVAIQRAVGDDATYGEFIRWLDTRTPEAPAPAPEPEGPGFISRTFDRFFEDDEPSFNDRLERVKEGLPTPRSSGSGEAPKTLPGRREELQRGQHYNTAKGVAVWNGRQFQPVR